VSGCINTTAHAATAAASAEDCGHVPGAISRLHAAVAGMAVKPSKCVMADQSSHSNPACRAAAAAACYAAAAAAVLKLLQASHLQLGDVDEALRLSTDVHEGSKGLDAHLQQHQKLVSASASSTAPTSFSSKLTAPTGSPLCPPPSHWPQWRSMASPHCAYGVLVRLQAQAQAQALLTLQLPRSPVPGDCP
jgi:hypothetical protein